MYCKVAYGNASDSAKRVVASGKFPVAFTIIWLLQMASGAHHGSCQLTQPEHERAVNNARSIISVNCSQYQIRVLRTVLPHACSGSYYNCSLGLNLFGPSSACFFIHFVIVGNCRRRFLSLNALGIFFAERRNRWCETSSSWYYA
ncbi:hypothetical protein GQ44DRAFT_57154 [Phaeosphaeriaceae sp. PMI808]|nr:hypothetical protein GQ44DRAFT_57154 [Phaeosphaeriaceae sp. PMI808]